MRKKKQKPRQSSKAKNILRSSTSKNKKITRLFGKLSIKELRLSSKDVYMDKELSDLACLYREKNDTRIYNYAIPDISLTKSVYWSLGVIKNNIEKLTFFCEQEKVLTDLILREKWATALSVLDKIDKLCGISMWANSIRASILAEQGEYAALDELYKELTSNLYNYNMYEVICKQSIYKSYHDETVIESRNRLNRQLRNTFGDDLYYFLKYKILTFNPTEKYDFTHIFNYENNSTLIDLYLCVSDFTIYSELNSKNEELKSEIIGSLSRSLTESIFNKISDLYKKNNNSWYLSDVDSDLLEKYTKGDYVKTLENVLNRKKHLSFNSVKISSKALCRIKEYPLNESYLHSLIVNFSDYFSKSENFTKSQNELHKQSTNFKHLNFFKKLNIFLTLSDSQEQELTQRKLKELSFLLSDINSAFRSDYILPENIDNYLLDTCKENDISTLALFRLYKGCIPIDSKELENVDINRKMSYFAKYLSKQGNHLKVIDILSALQKSSDTLTRLEAANLLIQTYIDNNNETKGIDIFNDYVLENKNFIHCLDSKKVAMSAESRLKRNPKLNDIIALSLYCRFVDNSKYKTLRAAFNNFMRCNKLQSPLNIINQMESSAARKEVHYFLNYVATPQIMKFFKGFRSPTDIDKCRVNICNYLISIGEAKNQKIAEVKSITKKLVLREATLQVAQSKVDADLSDLKAGKNESHISLFESYIKLREKNKNGFENTMGIYKVISKIDTKDFEYTLLHQDFFNELSNIFVKIVRTVIEEFAFGEKGLNANISTRIRHGHLPNTIRRSLLDEKITTSISKNTKAIRPNDFWITKLNNDDNKDNISKAFSTFTQNLEDLIYKLNEEVLQVNTLEANITGLSKSTKAFFRYSPMNEEIIYLQEKVDETCTYSEFITIIESWLWELTDKNLQEIRLFINENISPNITKELTETLANQNIAKEAMYDFNNALHRANRGLAQNVKTVESWFKRSALTTSKPFDLEIAAQIASQALLLDIELKNKDKIELKGNKLSSLVDILYILYENSISKSGLDKANIEIIHTAQFKENCLTIKYENSCTPYESAVKENEKIQEFVDSYGNEEVMMQRIHNEGGTGFAKIWKILQKDLNCSHTMIFGFTENNSFCVELKIINNGLMENEDTTDRR